MTPSAKKIGDDGERRAAEYLSPLDPECQRVKRYGYGDSDQDLTLVDRTSFKLLCEVKTDKGLWSARYAAKIWADRDWDAMRVTGKKGKMVITTGDEFLNLVLGWPGGFDVHESECSYSKGYAKTLRQAEGYLEMHSETVPVIPFALFQLRQGRGRPWKHMVAMDDPYFSDLMELLSIEEEWE